MAELVVIGVLVGLGLMIAVAFLIFNIVWRQNKSEPFIVYAELEIYIVLITNAANRFMKASSPWINVILIMGIIIRIPVSLLSSIAASTVKYGFNSNYIVPLCYASLKKFSHSPKLPQASSLAPLCLSNSCS